MQDGVPLGIQPESPRHDAKRKRRPNLDRRFASPVGPALPISASRAGFRSPLGQVFDELSGGIAVGGEVFSAAFFNIASTTWLA